MFTGLFVAPRLRGLELIMVADYFELKFGRLARAGLFLLLSDPIVILILGLSAQVDPSANAQATSNAQLALPSSWYVNRFWHIQSLFVWQNFFQHKSGL